MPVGVVPVGVVPVGAGVVGVVPVGAGVVGVVGAGGVVAGVPLGEVGVLTGADGWLTAGSWLTTGLETIGSSGGSLLTQSLIARRTNAGSLAMSWVRSYGLSFRISWLSRFRELSAPALARWA